MELEKLKALAEEVKGWSNCNQAWVDVSEDTPAVVVGHINEDGETFPVVTVDCDQYYEAQDSIKLARFYAAANPAAVLGLIERLGEAPRWRDVVDELPQEAQEVLFVRGGKTVHGAWVGGIFWHSNQQMAAAQWMPLPEPPKVGAGDTAKYDEKEPLHGKDAYQLSEA